MLDKNVVDLLNQQVNKEFYSAYLYLEFSNFYYKPVRLVIGNWFKSQGLREDSVDAMLLSSICRIMGKRLCLTPLTGQRQIFQREGCSGRDFEA